MRRRSLRLGITTLLSATLLGGATPAVAYEGAIETVLEDALRFILWGLGLTDTAIARYADTGVGEALVPS